MTPRRWATVFFISLAINFLLVGVIGAALWQHERGRASRMTVYSVPWAFRVIGEEVGAEARRIYLKYQGAMAAERRMLMRDYRAINEALAAPQFDRERFEAALGKLRADSTAAHTTMHDAMAEFAAELTPEQRRTLAATVNEWAENREQRELRRDELIEEKERRESAK